MAFTFQHGDRPLEGYTIQRGVGRGGFGEVYYALSDGGKEVALKYLRDNPQIELRGVEHCMNLKSPHLVTIYDVRQNAAGDYFLVMEYVSGPSLRDLLIAEDKGLGPQKAAFFLREIAKGLGYLHDRGIVHRDLKPGNIFYEDGYVKIGDYGLSKFISVSHHSVQTTSVGTVHYMAPEVGSGNYHRGIDIYALGVILYEMLCGKVPFEGSSMGEVLMKHLTAQPEVDELPAPFGEVIRKALAKDPADRYQTVDEMTSAVFGEADIAHSVARFEPTSISMAAARVAEKVKAGVGGSSAEIVPPPVIGAPRSWEGSSGVGLGTASPGAALPASDRFARRRPSRELDAVSRIARGAGKLTRGVLIGDDEPHHFERILLAGIVAAALAGGLTMLFTGAVPTRVMFPTILTLVLAVTAAALAGGWLNHRFRIAARNTILQRIVVFGLGLAAVFGAMLFLREGWCGGEMRRMAAVQQGYGGYAPRSVDVRVYNMFAPSHYYFPLIENVGFALLAVMLLVDWTKRVANGAAGKITLAHAVRAGIVGGVACLFTGGQYALLTAGIAAAASLVVEAGVFFRLPGSGRHEPPSGRGVRLYPKPEQTAARQEYRSPAPPSLDANQYVGAPVVAATVQGPAFGGPAGPTGAVLRRSEAARTLWGITAAMLVVVAFLAFAAAILVPMSGSEMLAVFCGGVTALVAVIFPLNKFTRLRRPGFYRETVRPLVLTLFLAAFPPAFLFLVEDNVFFGDAIFALLIAFVGGAIVLALLDLVVLSREGAPKSPSRPRERSTFERVLWGFAAASLLSVGILAFIAAGTVTRGDDAAGPMMIGAACLAALVFALAKTTPRRRRGFYRETFRPLAITVCLAAAVAAMVLMGAVNLYGDDFMIAAAFAVAGSVFALFFTAIRGRRDVVEPDEGSRRSASSGQGRAVLHLLGAVIMIIAVLATLAVLAMMFIS